MSKKLHCVLGKYWDTPTKKRKRLINKKFLAIEQEIDIVDIDKPAKSYRDIGVQTEINDLFEKHFLNYRAECKKINYFSELGLKPTM